MHVKLPGVFVQIASLWHSPLFVAHSLISIFHFIFIITIYFEKVFINELLNVKELGKKKKRKEKRKEKERKRKELPIQLIPSPKNPDLQEQFKLPGVFVQIALISHPPLFVSHSLISFSQKFPIYPIPEQLQYAAFVSVLSIHTPWFKQFNLSHPVH